MHDKERIIHNKLIFKITFGFISIILVSTIILGFISFQIFKDYMYKNKKNNMSMKAHQISTMLMSHDIEKETNFDYESLSNYVEPLANGRIWISDKNGNLVFLSRKGCKNHMMAGGKMGANLDNDALTSAIKGNTFIKESKNAYYDENMLLVAEPIYNKNNEINGAILLFSPIQDLKEAQGKFLQYLTYALIIELMLAGILSFYFSKFITKPILSMVNFSGELIKGNYKVKNNIVQKDEIGLLANSLNELSKRLDDNVKVLMEEESLRKEFVANVSHEFRTPLTILKGRLESLIDGVIEDKNIQYNYESMLKEVNRLSRMVNDLLDLSKLQNNKLQLNIEDIDVELLLEEVLDNISVLAKEAGIKLNADIDISSITIKGDYDRLKQLLIIFLDNAVKYSPKGTYIDIKVSTGEYLNILIKDHGYGIAEDDLKYIWQRFYKGDKSRTQKGGTGLGLAIAKHIIELHKGKVQIQSNLKEGTTVILSLPI